MCYLFTLVSEPKAVVRILVLIVPIVLGISVTVPLVVVSIVWLVLAVLVVVHIVPIVWLVSIVLVSVPSVNMSRLAIPSVVSRVVPLVCVVPSRYRAVVVSIRVVARILSIRHGQQAGEKEKKLHNGQKYTEEMLGTVY